MGGTRRKHTTKGTNPTNNAQGILLLLFCRKKGEMNLRHQSTDTDTRHYPSLSKHATSGNTIEKGKNVRYLQFFSSSR